LPIIVDLQIHCEKCLHGKNGKTATFMPKPVFGDNGSGMHVHSSIWKNNKNVFFDPSGYAQISDTAKYYIGGLAEHAPALLAITNQPPIPIADWFRGYEAPVNLAYSAEKSVGGLPHSGNLQ